MEFLFWNFFRNNRSRFTPLPSFFCQPNKRKRQRKVHRRQSSSTCPFTPRGGGHLLNWVLGSFSAYVVKNACLSAVALERYGLFSVPQSEFFFDRFLGTFSKKVPRGNVDTFRKKEP
jgi:hypothetical protein